MLPFELKTPSEVAKDLASRVRELRVERKFTQAELAKRTDIAVATYRRFEQTGEISLDRLLRIAQVLGVLGDFNQLFQTPPARSLDELERQRSLKGRRRVKKT
jgi:transcriptional regulator with XRE-family HTH domain